MSDQPLNNTNQQNHGFWPIALGCLVAIPAAPFLMVVTVCVSLMPLVGYKVAANQGAELFLPWIESACDEGNTNMCLTAAGCYRYGEGTAQDHVKGMTFYEKACTQGSGEGCHELGLVFAEGRVVPKDDARAAELYIQACDMGSHHACGDAGGRLMSGWGVDRDLERGLAMARRGCRAGARHACKIAANHAYGSNDYTLVVG